MKKEEINLEAPIYESKENQKGFSYTTFQNFLDSQFRKDLYKSLNTDNYEEFCKLEIQKRNLPLWLCESIYEYACSRNCNESIINDLEEIISNKSETSKNNNEEGMIEENNPYKILFSLSDKDPSEMKKLFKQEGLDANMTDDEGRNAMHHLAMHPGTFYKNNVEVLISAGVDINKEDNYGWSPVYTAIRYKNYDFVKYLKSKGGKYKGPKSVSEINLKENRKRIHFLIFRNRFKPIFLTENDTVDLRNHFRRAPLANYYMPDVGDVIKDIKRKGLSTIMFCHNCNDSWAIGHALWMEKKAKRAGIKPIHGFIRGDYYILPKTNEAYVKIWNKEKLSGNEYYKISCFSGDRMSQAEKIAIVNDCNVNMKKIQFELKLDRSLECIIR